MKILILLSLTLLTFSTFEIRAQETQEEDDDLISFEQEFKIESQKELDRVRALSAANKNRLPKDVNHDYNPVQTQLEADDLANQIFTKKYMNAPSAEGAEKIVQQVPIKSK